MFVINPDQFLLPSFRISPFQTSEMAFNNQLPNDDFASEYFNERFGNGNWHYAHTGREAIGMAMKNYNLNSDDLVTILTTSQNFYISSCVTSTIEKICKWNREIVPETKIIFVNHEFGYPYQNMENLIATGLPIVEDCCTTFFSQDAKGKIGQYGDYAVYSFPKFFPLQIGGLLVSNKANRSESMLSEIETNYIRNTISYHLKNKETILEKRRENYKYGLSLFSKSGFSERFPTNKNITPSVLMLNNNGIAKDLNMLRVFLAGHGIQNSIFYGEDAFFIPAHQNLTASDYDYFLNCMEAFLSRNSGTQSHI